MEIGKEMTAFNLVITILTSVITLLSLTLGVVKDADAVRGILGLKKKDAKAEIARDDRRERVTESGLIIPKPSTYHTRESIRYDN